MGVSAAAPLRDAFGRQAPAPLPDPTSTRSLDAHLARSRPQVESESILVAIRSLPAGAPVTVWDVALKDWPKAMVPAAAMRVTDDLENLVARHPLREGQPVLAVQLVRAEAADGAAVKPVEVVSSDVGVNAENVGQHVGSGARIRANVEVDLTTGFVSECRCEAAKLVGEVVGAER